MPTPKIFALMTIVAWTAVGHVSAAERGFRVVRGQHVAVCEAYRERLSATYYEDSPFCDRPEDASMPGFSMLDREPLSIDEAFRLRPSIAKMEPIANTEGWTLQAAERELGHAIRAWTYNPSVDIENNGSFHHVVMWMGSRIQWGVQDADFFCGDSDGRNSQLAFIIDPAQGQVDEDATRRVFWREKPAILTYKVDGHRNHVTHALPLGQRMSIFKFQDLYYFDAFYDTDGWGDYQNKRRDDKTLTNTLGVFLHRNGETREVCELRLN